MVTGVSRSEIEAFEQSGAFDEKWYLAEYPDVGLTGIDPVEHFLWIGKRLGRRPSPHAVPSQRAGFSADASTQGGQNGPSEAAKSVRAVAIDGSGQNDNSPPAIGAARVASRLPAFVRAAAVALGLPATHAARRDPAIDPHLYDTVAAEMSAEFYLLTYPDIARAGVDPVGHYIATGWREGRNPNIGFSTRYYLESNPDVAQAGVNPYYHWLVAGRQEGREGKHALGFRYDILVVKPRQTSPLELAKSATFGPISRAPSVGFNPLAELKPVAEQISEMKALRRTVQLSAPEELRNRLAELSAANARLVLSFSHDDFQYHVGGVQLLLRRELAMLRDKGWTQFHVYPAHPLLYLDTSGEAVVLVVVINGEVVGYYRPQDIIVAASAMADNGRLPRFVIHSLLAHNIDQTIGILEAFGIAQGYFWIHDYAALYNNYKLLRNDVEYCGVPRNGTIAYQLCEFARAPFCQADEFAKLFARFQVQVISPSQTAHDIWCGAGLHAGASLSVLPHCHLEALPTAPRRSSPGGPLKVGFLGYPAAHKGWPVFVDLALRFGDDPRYSFYHLGKGRQGGLPVAFYEVMADASNPDAMRAAVAVRELDVALAWSIWPETFCLTAYEALAGGAALVGNPDGGNIPRLIETMDCGLVLADEAALSEAFASGEVLALARDRRPAAAYTLVYSALTATYLGQA